ncbi:AraC family transcriptional regulator [uncultured Polaribacter sp.]|uniref:helix-turn-helix domain-containing protein n=1 Tax=uncultured Polaribacter sp. TaxID=174711 RepID=UPI0030DA8C34
MILIFSIISSRFLIHGSYQLGLQTFLKPDKGLYSLLFLTIVPASYLYYYHLTSLEKEYNFKDLKHLIFIVVLYVINSIEALDDSFLFYFGPITNFFFIAIFMLFYLILIFNLLSRKIWFKKNLELNNEHFKLIKNWTISFFTINTLGSVMVLVSIYTEFNKGEDVSGKTMAIFSMLFWLFIFFKILISPEILYGLPILNKKLLKFNTDEFQKNEITARNNWIFNTGDIKSSQDQKLQEKIIENIESYILEVDKLSEETLIFRNQKASQSDIAEKLGVPTSHVVYLFKYHSKISFSEYRMNSRIQDAINLINNDFLSKETLESLAYKTGFSSYNPFFTAFKKLTTFSPQDYLKNKHTE